MVLALQIQPVYSEEHPDPQYKIGSLRLLRHQVETWDAIKNAEIDVVFNTAMTGDGKSLAASYNALVAWDATKDFPRTRRTL